jgi:tetratricopeptide (TPR) repeat protein
LTLLERAWQRPFLHPQAADLITALHPLPYLWGNWDEWLYISRKSVALFAGLERPLAQADMLAGIVDILFELGRYEDACQVFAEMWDIPHTEEFAQPLLRAGHRVSTRLLLAGKIERGVAEYEKQRRWFNKIQARLSPEDRWVAHVYLILQETMIMRRQSRQLEAVAAIETVIAELAAWPHVAPDLRREIHHHHGGIRLSTDEFTRSVAAMDLAIQCAVEMDDAYTEASLYMDKSLPLWAMGDFDQVETAVRRGIHLCEKLQANWRMLIGLRTLVDVFVVKGEFEQALQWGERLITLAQQLGDVMEEHTARTTQGIVLLNMGQPQEARACLEESLPMYEQKAMGRWLTLTKSNLALCWANLGEETRGYQFAQQGVAHAQEARAINVEIVAWRGLAYFQTGQEKRESLERSFHLAQAHQVDFGQAASLLLLAACSSVEAEQKLYWQQATDLLQKMGIVGWLNGRSPQNPPYLPLIA